MKFGNLYLMCKPATWGSEGDGGSEVKVTEMGRRDKEARGADEERLQCFQGGKKETEEDDRIWNSAKGNKILCCDPEMSLVELLLLLTPTCCNQS